MAEILSLPCRVDPEAARRLAAALTEMIEDGRDPGPRGAQIRSLGQSLETLIVALRVELDRLGMAEELGALMSGLEKVAHVASSYQADASA